MQAKREWASQNMVNHPKAGKLCVDKLQNIAFTDYPHGLLMNFANLFIVIHVDGISSKLISTSKIMCLEVSRNCKFQIGLLMNFANHFKIHAMAGKRNV